MACMLLDYRSKIREPSTNCDAAAFALEAMMLAALSFVQNTQTVINTTIVYYLTVSQTGADKIDVDTAVSFISKGLIIGTATLYVLYSLGGIIACHHNTTSSSPQRLFPSAIVGFLGYSSVIAAIAVVLVSLRKGVWTATNTVNPFKLSLRVVLPTLWVGILPAGWILYTEVCGNPLLFDLSAGSEDRGWCDYANVNTLFLWYWVGILGLPLVLLTVFVLTETVVGKLITCARVPAERPDQLTVVDASDGTTTVRGLDLARGSGPHCLIWQVTNYKPPSA